MQLSRDEMYKVVCLIVSPSTRKCGTGCFVEKESILYIVTAEHVKKDILPDTLIVFGEANSTNHQVLLSSITIGNWIVHPIADISAIMLDVNKLNSSFNNRFFPFSQIVSHSNPLSRDRELTIAGFPQGLGTSLTGASKFSPLTFRSFASSSYMSYPRADVGTMSDFFCIENPAMGGYSGGPVIDMGYISTPVMTQRYGDTTIWGFIHGTIQDNTGGKIALVTPGYYLKDII